MPLILLSMILREDYVFVFFGGELGGGVRPFEDPGGAPGGGARPFEDPSGAPGGGARPFNSVVLEIGCARSSNGTGFDEGGGIREVDVFHHLQFHILYHTVASLPL